MFADISASNVALVHLKKKKMAIKVAGSLVSFKSYLEKDGFYRPLPGNEGLF